MLHQYRGKETQKRSREVRQRPLEMGSKRHASAWEASSAPLDAAPAVEHVKMPLICCPDAADPGVVWTRMM
jgi:hypothetical protein